MDLLRLLPRRSRDRPGPGGAPITLPAPFDGISERWWRLSPRLRAGLVVALVVLLLALAGRGAARSPWGAPTPVLVTTSDLAPGQAVGVGVVGGADWPAQLVPDDALTDLGQLPADARVRGAAPAGTVLTERHLATGVAGLVDADEAAVPVPRDGQPPLRAGQVVDAIVTTVQGTASRVAPDARVLAVDADWLWVAAPAGRADALAGAATSGQLVLVVRGE